MEKPARLSQNLNPLRVMLPAQKSLRRLSGRCSPKVGGQQASPTVFPEKRGKIKASKQNPANNTAEVLDKTKAQEHRIDIGDEQSDLLGYEIFCGKLVVVNKVNDATDAQAESKNQVAVDGKLTTKALIWGTHMLHLKDVISISYNAGMRHFTVHSYPVQKRACGLSCFLKPVRSRKDFRFLAASPEEAFQWVSGFADHQCYVNCLPHPMVSSKKPSDFFLEPHVKSKKPPSVLVILNPRSGRGRSSKVFHTKVEPIFKLAGFEMNVVKTNSAGHAKKLANTVDFSTCPDGIICVGGDGIVNEVLNGLLSRNDQKEAISIPIGIIPAGSDNSLVWTVLGVRDPVSAAIAIVKGGLTATDVFAVEWIQTGVIHFGLTVSYFGFVSDVLELSEKYQKRFGPLRYFVAGVLKFLCLPKYSFEVEYLPVTKPTAEPEPREVVEMSEIYPDVMRGSKTEGIPRASSLSSIDSIMTPSRMSGDLDATGSTHAGSEPSDYVRALDPKSKRLSSGRNNQMNAEPDEVLHSQNPRSTTPNWPRTRSKSRTERGWTGLTAVNDSRTGWGNAAMSDKEDISTMSDPGANWDVEPKWDTEPKWDAEPHWAHENRIELPAPPEDVETGIPKEVEPKVEEKWVVKKGKFLGVLVCNHSCKTVQSLSSQVVAPLAEFDDNALDLLLVHGSGRFRLLRFFIRLQFGRHLSLPYVEYVKVKAVKLKSSKGSHSGCGIDGELLAMKGHVITSLLPEQCRLIGRPAHEHV